MFNDQIDFRFLSGDLDDEQGLSKPLDNILKDIEKNFMKPKQNYYFLLGVSGCGKTKTIFDVAKKYYTLIFDFTPKLMSDVAKAMNLIEYFVYMKDVDPELDCKLVVGKLYLSRLLILVYFLKENIITSPEEWLRWQYSANISDFTDPLIEILSQYNLIEIENILYRLKKWIRLDLQKKIVIAMDEANILVELHQNKFHDSKGNSFIRPLSTLIIRSFSFLEFPFIISGTHMKIMEKDSISSAVLKDYFENYIQINGFRCNNLNDAFKLVNRFLKLNQNQIHIFKKHIELFLGRSRIITNFLIHLMNSNEKDLENVILNWKKESIESTERRSFYSLIDKFVISNPNQWEKLLADLIYTFYLKDGIVRVNTLETDYMAAGFCFFHGTNGSDYEFKLSEVILNSTYLRPLSFYRFVIILKKKRNLSFTS
jgi:DNA-directed RNA polymerase subunit F